MSTNFEMQTTTIWSFPERGKWLTHKGDYPGNWSPYVPKNLILRYTNENDLVLDQFVGSGTTLIECKALNRRAIGCDVNDKAIELSKDRLKDIVGKGEVNLFKADARNLVGINDETIDFICTHPPYANIIKYSEGIKEDLSLLSVEKFIEAMQDVVKECLRVLKKGKYCAILIGDTRKNGYIIPLGFNVMNIFIRVGFKLKEIIIKEQHNCRSTKYWENLSLKKNFYLIAHEYLFIFKK